MNDKNQALTTKTLRLTRPIAHLVFVICSSVMGATWSQCDAALIYEFDFENDQYLIAPGETIDVSVLLREIATGGSVNRLAPGGDDGLFAAGFQLAYGGGDNALSLLAARLRDQPNEFNPDFTTEQDLRATSVFQIDPQARDAFVGIERVPTVRGTSNVVEVPIVSFQFRHTGADDSSTSLVLSRTSTPFGVLFADASEPGSIGFGTATVISTSAIPEPSSFLALGAIVSSVAFRRRR